MQLAIGPYQSAHNPCQARLSSTGLIRDNVAVLIAKPRSDQRVRFTPACRERILHPSSMVSSLPTMDR